MFEDDHNIEERSENEQTDQNEDEHYGRVMTSSTCHNLSCYDDQEDESNKENKLFKNKSESDLVIDKNKLKKIYLPAEDTMDMEQSFKESTGKKYSSSWFYGDSSKNPYPTIEEQVKLCRKIASQLVDDENRKSKGASMFFKRVKRSQKWVHEGTAVKDNNSSTNSSLTADEEVEKLKRNLKLEVMPKLKLVLDPRELLSLEKLKKTGDIVEHNIVSPDVCHNLVKDLNSPEINKGAAIFLKRKEKSQDWIVDENSTVVKIREQKREQELKKREEDVQKEWLMKKQKEMEPVESDFKTELRELKNELNFNLNAGQQSVSLFGSANQSPKPQQQICSPAPLNSKPMPKHEDNCQYVSQPNQSVKHNIQQNQFLKLNFKNFNRGARGWGIPEDEYEKQLQVLQKTPEYKISLTTYPIDQSIERSNNKPINNSYQKLDHPSITANYAKPNYNDNRQTSNLVYQQPKPIYTSYQQDSRQPIHQQPKIANQNHYSHQNQNIKISRSEARPIEGRPIAKSANRSLPRSTVSQQSVNPIAKPNSNQNRTQIEYSPFKNITHYNSSANFNTYIFNKPTDFANPIKNEDHNSNVNQSSQIYYQPQQQMQQHFNPYEHTTDNSIKQFDLTKLQNFPTNINTLPKFKDFNTYKPKLFVKC